MPGTGPTYQNATFGWNYGVRNTGKGTALKIKMFEYVSILGSHFTAMGDGKGRFNSDLSPGDFFWSTAFYSSPLTEDRYNLAKGKELGLLSRLYSGTRTFLVRYTKVIYAHTIIQMDLTALVYRPNSPFPPTVRSMKRNTNSNGRDKPGNDASSKPGLCETPPRRNLPERTHPTPPPDRRQVVGKARSFVAPSRLWQTKAWLNPEASVYFRLIETPGPGQAWPSTYSAQRMPQASSKERKALSQ